VASSSVRGQETWVNPFWEEGNARITAERGMTGTLHPFWGKKGGVPFPFLPSGEGRVGLSFNPGAIT